MHDYNNIRDISKKLSIHWIMLSKLLKKYKFKFRNYKIKCYDIIIIWKLSNKVLLFGNMYLITTKN